MTGVVAKRDSMNEESEDGPKKAKILAESFKLLSEVVGSGTEPVVLFVRADGQDPDWAGLGEIVTRYPGQAPVQVDLGRGNTCAACSSGRTSWWRRARNFGVNSNSGD